MNRGAGSAAALRLRVYEAAQAGQREAWGPFYTEGSARTLTQAMPDKGPTTLPGRIIAVTWLVVAVTAVAVFTAGLTTYFTTHQLRSGPFTRLGKV